jgi:hypothetical protein
MAIRMTFPEAAASPTGAAVVRVRYGMVNPGPSATVTLHYAHGTRQLTRAAWEGFAAAGATLSADDAREKMMIKTVLGVDLLSES